MMDFFAGLENLSFSIWVRESGSLWAYPGILFLHTVGLSVVVGVSIAVSLRTLGVARVIPLAPIEAFYKVLWTGFWVNALSGVALLLADATTKLINPVFYIKMGFVVLAMVATILLRRRLFRPESGTIVEGSPLPSGATLLATASLVFWVGAVTAGRLMAYLGPVSGAPGLNNSLGQ
jgi:hypothetical protein